MKTLILSVAIFAASTTLVQAQDYNPDWNYLEVYRVVNHDNDPGVTDFNLRGFALKGSLEVSDYTYLTGNYAHAGDNKNLDISINSFSVGGGFKLNLSDASDIYLGANYISTNTKFPIIGVDDKTINTHDLTIKGYDINLGIRSIFRERILLDANVSYANPFDKNGIVYKSVFTGSIDAIYKITNNFGLGIGLAYSREDLSYAMKARFSF